MDYKPKSIALTIPNGQSFAEGTIKLPAGTCIGVVTESAGTEPTKPVYITVKDGGNDVVEAINHKFLKKTAGGRWVDSVMPIGFKCDRNVTVRINTATAVTADFSVDTLFLVKLENY